MQANGWPGSISCGVIFSSLGLARRSKIIRVHRCNGMFFFDSGSLLMNNPGQNPEVAGAVATAPATADTRPDTNVLGPLSPSRILDGVRLVGLTRTAN